MTDPFLISAKFTDYDHFAQAVRSWDLNFIQLDKGPFLADLVQIGLGQLQISNLKMNRHMFQTGQVPAGMKSYAVPGISSSPYTAYKKAIPLNAVSAFSGKHGLDGVSASGFDAFTLSFTGDLLETAKDRLEMTGLHRVMNDGQAHHCAPNKMMAFQRYLSQLCADLAQSPSMFHNSKNFQEIQIDVAAGFLRLVASSTKMKFHHPPRMRTYALKRLETYIKKHARQPITVYELCKVARVSERSLRYAFMERFGVSPKAYLQAVRLNGARRELWQSDPHKDKVSDVANHWGFWHMGKFAADYRRQFGELPSDTLKNNRSL